jgi:N-acetylneuraminic acid mutarotase
MKINLLNLFIFSQIICFGQNWIQIDDFPATERDDGTSFVIGDSAYCGSGLNSWWSTEGDFYGIDLTNDQWFTINSLPIGKERQYSIGFSGISKGYVFGGHNGTSFLNDLWEYNPETDAWIEKPSLPSVGRSGSSCIVINDTAYIIGGETQTNQAINEVWAYDLINESWIQKNDLPFGNTWRSSATSIDDLGYLIFGKDEANNFQNELYEYSTYADTWSMISTFPSTGRAYAALNSIGNKLYISFGIDSIGNSHNDLWEYTLALNSWNILPGIPSLGRRGGMSFSKNNQIYYTTGINESNTRLKETWKFNPALSLPEFSQINISIVPNPAQEYIEIISEHEVLGSSSIYSSKGELIKFVTDQKIIDVSQLGSGIYFIHINTAKTTAMLKFIKT